MIRKYFVTQISLRTLFIVLTFLGLLFAWAGWLASRSRHERQIASQLRQAGIEVAVSNDCIVSLPNSLRTLFCDRVVSIAITEECHNPHSLLLCASLSGIDDLTVNNDEVHDKTVCDILDKLHPKYITLNGRLLGIESLRELLSHNNLRDVEIMSLPISEADFRTLCSASGIEHLSLPSCDLTDKFLVQLLLSPTMRTLDLRENSLSLKSLNQLRADNPEVTILGD